MLWYRGAGFLGGSPPRNPSFFISLHFYFSPFLFLSIFISLHFYFSLPFVNRLWYCIIIDNGSTTGKAMSEKRVLRKMKKLASSINDKMETVRDVMEDLEIEFELLQKQISKLESKKGIEIADESNDEADFVDESDEIIDLENTSVVTVRPKF